MQQLCTSDWSRDEVRETNGETFDVIWVRDLTGNEMLQSEYKYAFKRRFTKTLQKYRRGQEEEEEEGQEEEEGEYLSPIISMNIPRLPCITELKVNNSFRIQL